jgi:PKD repeat protein
MTRFFTTLILALLCAYAFAQKPAFKGQLLKSANTQVLDEQFNSYDVYQLDVASFNTFVKKAGESMEFSLQLGNHDWNIWLQPRDLRSPKYQLRVLTKDGIKVFPKGENLTFKGYLDAPDGEAVSLTIDKELIYGFVKKGGELYFIEPLWYFTPGVPKDQFVVYAASDVKPKSGITCGAIEMIGKQREHLDDAVHDHASHEKAGNCYTVELSIASDKSMFTKYGSVAGVQAHNIGVINNVQTNYDNEFSDELHFEIVEQFVVTGTDPWTSSNDPGALLDDFRDWAPNGFDEDHDLGELWTNRDFTGSTIGIAYINGVCNSFRYHCLQDFSSNANLLRVLTAHEIGHNLNATHDAAGSNTIMAPSVSNTNNWSAQSVSQINAKILQIDPPGGCLSYCATSLPPVAAFSGTPTSGCAPLTVAFTDQSVNNPNSWNWTFFGGTPGTSTQQNPTVVYGTAGSFNVSLTVSNGVGSNTSTQINYITVSTAPTAAFSFSQIGLTVIFTNNSSANATSYLWEFGDGQTSTQLNPIHTYSVDGFYDVKLTAYNVCGSNSFQFTIPVFVLPTANFTADPTSGCAALEVDFTSQSSANSLFYNWVFPGGVPSTSTEQNPTVLYANPGVYNVSLTVTNPAGNNTATKTNYITVSTIPIPNFTAAVNGATVTFTNSTTGASSYTWNFGDGQTSTQTNPTHTYTSNGTFTVTLTANNACGPGTITKTVTIAVAPTANFSASPLSGCANLVVNFTNTSSFATSYNWSFPGGAPSSSTAQNPTVTYSAAGTYDVTLIVSNNVGNDTLFFDDYIDVDALPSVSFTKSVSGTTVTFTNNSSNANSYLWNFGDGNTSTATNPVHTYAGDGVYTVSLSATNDCGTQSSAQTVVIVTPPTAGFSANVTSGCLPLTVNFINQSSANATSFNWEFPGGNPSSSTAQNPSVTYNAAGTYTVTLTVSNAAGNNTVTQTNYIAVNTTPTAGFTKTVNGLSVNFTNTSSNATSYSWNFGDGNTSTATNPSHTYAADGTYTVTLSATNPCGTVTSTQTVVIVTPPTAGFSANNTSGCAPLTVNFSNQSSANATSFNWSFPGGSPSSSTAPNPTVTYNAPGTYNVTLIVSNAAGADTITQTNYVTANGAPTAGFTVTTNVFVANFTNTTTGATSYSWNFGDGNTSTQTNPTHTYAEDGTYTVTLTATNACGSNTYTQTVVITSLPTPAFSANSTTGCAPFTVNFIDQSSDNTTSWEWSFPGGTPSSSTQQNPTVTYNTPGTYSVTLTVSNALGSNTTTQTNYITVNTVPSASFTNSVNGTTATFTNTSTGATSYTWNFGDGNTSTQANPSHTYAGDGTYTVTLTATNGCGSTTSTKTVVVVTPPTAGFSANATTGCAPFTVNFTNQSSANATTFQWTFPGGNPGSSTAQNPTVVYSAPGTYSVTLVASNAAGANTATQTNYITVNTVPVAGFTKTQTGKTVSFTNTSTNATSYSWNFGDGKTSTEQNPEHTYEEDGAYTVTLTATNGCGSVTFTQTVVIATEGPQAAFTAAKVTGCPVFAVTFENLSANATSFQWNFQGGNPATSTEENPLVNFALPGTYDVMLIASNAVSSDTFFQAAYITVLPLPTAGFTQTVSGGTVTFTNTSTNGTQYLWNFGDGNTSSEASPVHTYQATGAYVVTLTVTNECGNAAVTKTINVVVTGVEDIPGITEFNVFPNPNTGRFTLTLKGEPLSQLELDFTNLLGQCLLSEKVDFRSGELSKQFFFDDLSSGMYIFSVKAGDKALFKKIVVE